MSDLFPPTRSLLYPQFETYRLHALDPSDDVTSFPLPGSGATQSRVGHNQHHLSFKEVRARIGFDHLATGDGARGVYIDADWNVVGFQLMEGSEPVFSQLASLPQPIASSSSSEQTAEYPSVLALTSTHWAISSGSGSLYVLETSTAPSAFDGRVVAHYEFAASSTSQAVPFLLQAAHALSPQDCRLLFSCSVPAALDSKGKAAAQTTHSELIEVSIDLAKRDSMDQDAGERLEARWTLRGEDLPLWCLWWEEGWLVLSSEVFESMTTEGQEARTGQAEGQSSINTGTSSRLGSGLDVPDLDRRDKGPSDLDMKNDIDRAGGEAIQPYSWTQTPDSLSLTIPFPLGTTRRDVTVSLTDKSLSLQLDHLDHQAIPPNLSGFLVKPSHGWWTGVDVHRSTWTFDPAKGILEIEIAKLDGPNRWPSVFGVPEDEEEEEQVPETLSASTLAAVRQTFKDVRTRGPDEPEGNHAAMPALIREEMDFELEDGEEFDGVEGAYGDAGGSKVGRDVFIGHVKEGQARWSKTTSSVVSMPLASVDESDSRPTIMVKSAVDGLLFCPTARSDPVQTPWSHLSTSPALSFVLSSKRDLRSVRHIMIPPPKGSSSTSPPSPKRAKTDDDGVASVTVLAFESGTSANASGNVYVYYPPTSRTVAKQGVVRVSGGERGALLGVGCVHVGGRSMVVALCEKELVVLDGI